jgi:hypothetical protein
MWPKHTINPEQVRQLGKTAYAERSAHAESGNVAAAH